MTEVARTTSDGGLINSSFSRRVRELIDNALLLVIPIIIIMGKKYFSKQQHNDKNAYKQTNINARTRWKVDIYMYIRILRSKFGKLPNWRCLCNLVVRR